MRLRPLVFLTIIFVCGIGIGLILSMGKSSDEGADSVDGKDKHTEIEVADVEANDIELVQGKDGQILWKVRAASAKYSQAKKVVVVVNPQMTSYLGEEREEVFVRSDMGEVNQKGNNLNLWDNVDGRYGLFTLKSHKLDYIGSLDKVFLKGEVSLSRPDFSVNASVVEIDVNSRQMEAAGNVSAYFIPEKGIDLDENDNATASEPEK